MSGPSDRVLLLFELFELHSELALGNFILREHVKMRGQPDCSAPGNEPLGGIELVPPDSVPVVHWELVMEVVVPFAEGYQRRQQVVPRCQLVVVCGRS